VEGWRRTLGAPWVAAGLLAATAVLASMGRPGYLLTGSISANGGQNADAIGRMAVRAEAFEQYTEGLGWIVIHESLGFGGRTADIAASLIADEPVGPSPGSGPSPAILMWLFLSGGILDRLARARRTGTAAFFSACGVYFVRFLRLGVALGLGYFILFVWIYPHGVAGLYARLTADVALAEDARPVHVLLTGIFVILLMGVGMVADFSKVRTVVEDRRSMMGALAASIRFVRRRLVRVVLLYLLNATTMLAIILSWQRFSAGFSWPLGVDLQITTLLLIWTRLAFMASEIAFFQGELAHAGYTAAPVPVWPDSPAAEAIDNLTRQTTQG
jgi:hypothetical protein